MHPHTLTARGRLNDKRFCSFGAPFSNQTLVPLYFLPVSKLCYHQCQHHSFFLFIFFSQSSWLTVYRASEAAGESGVIRETMDTSLSNKQDRLCCLPVGDSGKRKGLWERERETDRLETDISNVRGRITSLLLGCTQGSSRIQIPQFSNAVIMHSTQTLRACCFDWFFRHRYLDLSVVCRKTRVKKIICFFSFSPKMWFGMT